VKVKMNIDDALAYSTGQYITALERGRKVKRDAVHLANWRDTAVGLHAAIIRLPKDHAVFLLTRSVTWDERSIKNHLQCATSSAKAAIEKVKLYWLRYKGTGQRWDVLAGALEDAETSVKDLIAATRK
jgi:hypothetical protein